ncbi:hypothetical protein T4A_10475 [Trichinella pseudospiralis]|uniref:Uncharacterized protein n=1 Tax=Trichinella pseudospiralis TaxID=6337 RepID=A0A0V1DTA9_TRIPS|nr:hypothetical protein T4A_10475 [Trichinella pseudospiralis]
MGVALLRGYLHRSESCLRSFSAFQGQYFPIPSVSSTTVAASLTGDLLNASLSVFSFSGIHFAVNAYRRILRRKRSWHTLSSLYNEFALPMRLLCILIRSLRNATLRLRGVVIQLVPCATDPIRLSDLWRCLSYKDEEHPRAMLFGVEGDKTPLETQSMSGSQVAGRISSAFKSRRITEYIRFSLGVSLLDSPYY